jgi:hypothetical protein
MFIKIAVGCLIVLLFGIKAFAIAPGAGQAQMQNNMQQMQQNKIQIQQQQDIRQEQLIQQKKQKQIQVRQYRP